MLENRSHLFSVCVHVWVGSLSTSTWTWSPAWQQLERLKGIKQSVIGVGPGSETHVSECQAR